MVELLVVIAIIALLLSILMPSLSKVKESAKKTVCASNLHQYGIAFSAYSADNGGKIMATPLVVSGRPKCGEVSRILVYKHAYRARL